MLSFSKAQAAELLDAQLAAYESNVASGVPKDVAAMLFHANIKEYVRRYRLNTTPQFLAEGRGSCNTCDEISLDGGPVPCVPQVP